MSAISEGGDRGLRCLGCLQVRLAGELFSAVVAVQWVRLVGFEHEHLPEREVGVGGQGRFRCNLQDFELELARVREFPSAFGGEGELILGVRRALALALCGDGVVSGSGGPVL